MIEKVSGKSRTLPADSRDSTGHVSISQTVDIGKGPFILLIVYLSFEFIRPQYYFPAIGVIRPGLLLGVAMALCWLKVWGPKSVYHDPLLRYYLFILVFALIWVPLANNNFWAFQRFEALLTYFLGATIPLSLVLRDRRRRHRFVTFWIAVHVYLAVFGMTHAGRGPGSFLSDENDLALALCMSLPYPFLFSQLKSNKLLHRVLYIGAALIMILGVIWTNSRGGFVGLICVMIYMLWLSKHRIRNLLVVLVLSISAIVVAPDSYIEQVRSISDPEDSTRSARILFWQVGWEMFLDNPIFGVGPGNYPWHSGYYQKELDTYVPGEKIFAGRAAHSLYFTVIPEFGLVGTIPCVLVLLGMLGRLRRFERRCEIDDSDGTSERDLMMAKSIRASIVGFLSTGAFISVLYYPHFWYSIGLVIALCEFRPRPKKRLRSAYQQF